MNKNAKLRERYDILIFLSDKLEIREGARKLSRVFSAKILIFVLLFLIFYYC